MNCTINHVTYCCKKSGCDLEMLNRIREEDVRVVSLERAIVDSTDCPSLAGGLEEIEYALDSCRKLKIDKTTMLLEHYDKTFLYQKVGYLFEKNIMVMKYQKSFINYAYLK